MPPSSSTSQSDSQPLASPPDRGRAALEVRLVDHASTVTGAYAASPMKLLSPRSRGLSAWTFTSNFGGGLVAGDQTRLDLRVGPGARCFLGTQSATKVYRNPDRRPCSHLTQAVLEADAFLAFLPAPVQPFADSSYSQRQTFHLAPGAGLVLLDWFSAGRAARGERWAFAHFSSRNEVFAETEGPVFLDSLRLDAAGDSLLSPHRTGRFNCFAMLFLLGAPLQEAVALILEAVGRRAIERRPSLLVSASPVRNGAVLRVAATQVEAVEAELHEHLGFLSGWLGGLPWTRRW